MIEEIRKHFVDSVKSIDSCLKQHDQYFIEDDISDSKIEDTYFLKIGTFVPGLIDTNYQGSFDVTLTLWKNGRKKVISSLDKAYCNAIEIMATAQNQERIDQTSFIKQVNGVSIAPEQMTSNASMAKIVITFTVLVSFKNS